MPRKTPAAAAPAPAVIVAAVPVAEPVPAPRKAKRSRTEAAAAVEIATVSTVPATEPAATVELTVDEHIARLKTLYKAVGEAVKDAYKVMKAHNKQLKLAAQAQKRNRRQRAEGAPPAKPSGITKKQAVSAELLKFFDKPEGTLLSRTDVSSLIFQYVSEKKLISEAKKSEWNPDAALQKLLRLNAGDVLSMAKVQKVIGVHFPASAKAIAAAAK
jgi:chromatin remodeling complex protein RSC6